MDISHDIIGLTPVDPNDGQSGLVGKLVRVKLLQPQLLYRVVSYDHSNRTLELFGPVPGHNVCDDGEPAEPDTFSDYRSECEVVHNPSELG